MRLVCTLNDQNKAFVLSSYLLQQGIESQLEIVTNTDWGSSEYGTPTCRLWIVEEDSFEKALEISKDFMENPDDPKFITKIENGNWKNVKLSSEPSAVLKTESSIGIITLYLLIACSLLLFVGKVSSPVVKSIPPGLPYEAIISPPVNKALFYDYPKTYEMTDKLVATYGLEPLKNPSDLPESGQALFQQIQQTPYWQGFYPKFVDSLRGSENAWNFNAPMFEKIQQGELWRLISPVLLHGNFIHLLFNMLWLAILGRQIEQRIGKKRYLLFIVITALISNTAQYLMIGPNFLGFSGVLCAMFTFIWYRQKHAPWEGYLLEPGTLLFVSIFILLMASLQLFAFYLEIFHGTQFPLGIGNTAHLSGALVGLLLARLNSFAWR